MRVLVVDAANVVGSRPDGWWRDRAGAAARLHARLVAAELAYDEVVLVLEGKARAGQPEGRDGNIRTVHANGSGDDAIVAAVTELAQDDEVLVVTADRGLQSRVETAGARFVRPSWVLDRLES
jgi:hypothetical protein